MKRLFAAAAVLLLTTVALTGCRPRTVMQVDANGNTTIFEEIIFTQEDLASMPEKERTCDGILAKLHTVVTREQLALYPDRVEPGDIPGIEEDGSIVCRFYSDEADKKFEKINNAGGIAKVVGDTAVFNLPAETAMSIDGLITDYLRPFRDRATIPVLMVRMPGKLQKSILDGKESFFNVEDAALFQVGHIKGGITVTSGVGDVAEKPQPEEASKAGEEQEQNVSSDVTVSNLRMETALLRGVAVLEAVVIAVLGVAVVVLSVLLARRRKNTSILEQSPLNTGNTM